MWFSKYWYFAIDCEWIDWNICMQSHFYPRKKNVGILGQFIFFSLYEKEIDILSFTI